jgi:tight adherence protein B
MSEEALVPFLGVFAATAMFLLAGWLVLAPVVARRRQAWKRRLSGAGEDAVPTLILDALPERRATAWSARFDRGFEQLIARTGLDLDANLALALILFSGVALAVLVFVWRYEAEAWLALPAFALGAALPLVYFWWRQGAWRRILQDQLPDALFLLARSIRAGRSLDQALQLVGEQGVPPLAREFARLARQLELGLSLSQALRGTAARLGLVDFNVFAAVVSLHRATGGGLPVILDRLAITTRDRNQFRGQYRAATALGRYCAGFLVFLVTVILVYLFFFQREWALRFFESGTGLFLFTCAMVLEVLGGVLLYWFVRYDY